jgi:hypothetical protein
MRHTFPRSRNTCPLLVSGDTHARHAVDRRDINARAKGGLAW